MAGATTRLVHPSIQATASVLSIRVKHILKAGLQYPSGSQQPDVVTTISMSQPTSLLIKVSMVEA
jgi:hypothetical protein